MPSLHILLLLLTLPAFAQNETRGWFPFQPGDYFAASTLSMQGWLDAPAGKHGFLQMRGKDFVFENGKPVKFWGVNVCDHKAFPEADEARTWAKFLAKYGINGVRLHKFTWEASDGVHSTQITADHWRRLDFFQSELRRTGIYYGWSAIYGHRVRPGDRERLLAYDEVAGTKFPWRHLNGSTASLVNFAEDLQTLNIELTVSMLNHRNPHTGLRYADDPALAFIELQNEDNIFWGAIEETLKQTPTYRALLCQKFSDWLRRRYGSHEALLKAWQGEGLSADEHLDRGSVYPRPNHGQFQAAVAQAEKSGKPLPAHWLDRAAFLYEEQVRFYEKFVKAIRATGYRGVIVGSCWQAGAGLTHWYNLHADYLAGAIDRHNYFGGGSGHQLQPGPFNNTPMVSQPGSGLLSTGFQQVADRPFQFSEWMSLIPNEWTAEASPLIAAYGMGLQGWDASYAFAMDQPKFSNTIQMHGVYNVTSPTQLALYPALAAMIYRGDVREGQPAARRTVGLSDLAAGRKLYFEKVSQQYDLKSFEGAVPTSTLAVGPVTVAFAEKDKPLETNGIPQEDQKRLIANTGQLTWDVTRRGYFTIQTAGTVGLVGFSEGQPAGNAAVEVRTETPFAVVLVSSLDPKQGLDKANRWLITTVARARNTGMTFDADHKTLLTVGEAPILLEPVNVDLRLKRRGKPTVHVLDHVGNRTGRKLPVLNGVVRIDGEREKTIYYEVVF